MKAIYSLPLKMLFLSVTVLWILPFFSPYLSYAEENPLALGKKRFNHFCSQCHGEKGSGDGVNSEYIDPPPRDLTDSIKEYLAKFTNEQIIKAITIGGAGIDKSRNMPMWGMTLSEYEIGAVAGYVRTLHPNNAGPVDLAELSRERPKTELKEVNLEKTYLKSDLKIAMNYYKKFGCNGCHKINQLGGRSGPALDGIGSLMKARDIFNVIKNPLAVKENSRMPNLGLSDEHAAYLTGYLMSLK